MPPPPTTMKAEGRRGGGGRRWRRRLLPKKVGKTVRHGTQDRGPGRRTSIYILDIHAYFAFKLNLLRDSLTYKLQLQLNQKDTACLGLMIKSRKIQFPFAFLAIVTFLTGRDEVLRKQTTEERARAEWGMVVKLVLSRKQTLNDSSALTEAKSRVPLPLLCTLSGRQCSGRHCLADRQTDTLR